MEALFMSGLCIELPGYTSFAIKMLKEARLSVIGRSVKTFGGLQHIPVDLAMCCLQRMASWTRLSKVITDSEFPALELCARFMAFTLKTQARQESLTEGWRNKSLTKLAMAFRQPVDKVLQQFFDVYPIAQNIFRCEGVANTEAWSLAVRRCFAPSFLKKLCIARMEFASCHR